MWTLAQVKRSFDRLVDVAVMMLTAVLASVVFVAVVTRYFFNFPLAWSEEVSRYSFVWLSFLGAEVCLRKGAHIGVDLLVRSFPGSIQHHLETGGRLVMGIMLAVLFIAGIKVTVVAHDQQSPALGMPMSYVYLALPVGAALMLWELLIQSLNPREVPASSGG